MTKSIYLYQSASLVCPPTLTILRSSRLSMQQRSRVWPARLSLTSLLPRLSLLALRLMSPQTKSAASLISVVVPLMSLFSICKVAMWRCWVLMVTRTWEEKTLTMLSWTSWSKQSKIEMKIVSLMQRKRPRLEQPHLEPKNFSQIWCRQKFAWRAYWAMAKISTLICQGLNLSRSATIYFKDACIQSRKHSMMQI